MLVRAAGRKARHNPIVNTIIRPQPYLPFLYPTINSHPIDRSRRVHTESRPQGSALRKRRNSTDSSAKPQSRSLATAVDAPFDFASFENALPISSFGLPKRPPPIVISDDSATVPERHRRSIDGVVGTTHETIAILKACLQVGRIERATVILNRIGKYPDVDEETFLGLQNQYLRAAVENLIMNPSESAAQTLHKWFELEVRHKGRLQDAVTIGYMLKASLRSLLSSQRDRLVRRYMDMVQGDAGLEVLGANILSDEELNNINHICPTYNLAEGLEEVQENFDANTSEGESNEISATFNESGSAIPEVKPTDQKGLGLKSLKQSLSLFTGLQTSNYELANMNEEEQRAVQAQLEQDAVQAAIDRWRDENASLTKMGLNSTLQSKSLGATMWTWQVALEAAIKKELSEVDQAESGQKAFGNRKDSSRCSYGPFLRYVPPDKLAALTILSLMNALSTMGLDKGLHLTNAIMAIAKNVENESILESVLNDKTKSKTIWRETNVARKSQILLHLKRRRAVLLRGEDQSLSDAELSTPSENQEIIDETMVEKNWPSAIKAEVGACLLSMLIDIAQVPAVLENKDTKEMVTQMQPAFSHGHQFKLGKKLGVILANKLLAEQLRREPVHSLLAKHLPMLVKPEPWTAFGSGGFITYPGRVMRVKHNSRDQKHYVKAAIERGNMETVFEGLNILGQQSWTINGPVFDVMLKAWNTGEPIANIAPESPNLEYPPEPDASTDPLERRRWVTAVKKVENVKGAFHSQRCFQNFQLEIARALRNKVFYFPHNVDFRGRAYPIPPYLNHMGADHCRGLLKFGKGKKLGSSGLRWLKIQLANVYGFDKASLSERAEFATNNLENIYDSASNPLDGKRWWLEAEDPWQCLAACIELRDALQSDDPTQFVSFLPVHQDGTCNGLQHYAALGGDVWGAQQVNLEPSDRPADVYTAVANLVKENIAEDIKSGDVLAQALDGKITRKVVKQTVMTNVYGVTYIGAKAQVRKQLLSAYKDLPDTPEVNPDKLSGYVATKIFKALSTMFKGAHDIQYWLGDCATRISKSITPEQINRLLSDFVDSDLKLSGRSSKGNTLEDLCQFKTSVVWTSPLNMPVVQPYRTSKARIVQTNLQRISLMEPHRSEPTNPRKQLQAFPPNFIHSLDATHMLLSAVKSNRANLSFAAVHDSFWTHACDIDDMNTILRSAFIEMHGDDIVGRLSEELNTRYKGFMQLAYIKSGSLLWNTINAFRKKQKPSERSRPNDLLIELQRLRLLRSTNPEEVKKGKKMVTAASIYEELATEGDLQCEPELQNMGLGDMNKSSTAVAKAVDEADTEIVGELMEEDLTLEHEADEDEDGEVKEIKKTISQFETRMTPKSAKKWRNVPTWVWIPLKFGPVPQKGDFDVTRLGESKYFFS